MPAAYLRMYSAARLSRKILLGLGIVSFLSASLANAAPRAVATAKPIHAILATVMQGVAEPGLLFDGVTSPHHQSLRPSQAGALRRADFVVWMGPGFETSLAGTLRNRLSQATVLELNALPGIEALPIRGGGRFEAHNHDHGEHAHDQHAEKAHEDRHDGHDHEQAEHHGSDGDKHGHNSQHRDEAGHALDKHGTGQALQGRSDPHSWLDPRNAAQFAIAMARALSRIDADNATVYERNAKAFAHEMKGLEHRLSEQLASLNDKPMLVFHDAYQYFERRFALNVVGAISLDPEDRPGARRVSELKQLIREQKVQCLFTEPQIRPALAHVLLEDTDTRLGELDPLGSAIDAGPNQYSATLEALANAVSDCLTRQ